MKVLVGALAIFSFLTGLVIAALPEIARRVAVSRLERLLTAPVSIDDVDLNIFTGKAVVSNLVVGATSSHPIVRLPTLSVNFSPVSCLFGPLVIENIRLARPRLYLQRIAPASFNFTQLLKKVSKANGGRSGIYPMTIQKATIDHGQITFIDKTVDPVFNRTLQNITLSVGRISTLPQFIMTPTSFAMSFFLGEGRIAMSGQAVPLARPSTLKLTIELDKIDPEIFTAYLPHRPMLDLTRSWISGQIRYVVAHGEKNAHYLTTNIKTGPVKLLSPDTQRAVLKIQGIEMRGLRWDFIEDRGRIDHLFIQRPDLVLVRNRAGFHLARLFTSEHNAAPGPEKRLPRIPLTVANVESRGGTIEYQDTAVAPNVAEKFRNVQIHLSDLSANDQPSSLQVQGVLGKSPVTISGTLVSAPFQTHLTVTTKNLPLEPYQGYWKLLWQRPSEWQGQLDGTLQLALAPDSAGGLSTNLSGDLRVHKLALSVP